MTAVRILALSVAALVFVAPHAAAQGKPPASPPDAASMPDLDVQVLLDRAGFSPGEIDGRAGRNTTTALAAFARARGLPSADPTAPAVLAALGAGNMDTTTSYTLTSEDVAGPFTPNIPDDMMAKAKLAALNYSTAVEAIAEKFHASPRLLSALNPSARFGAGEAIRVPNIRVDRGLAPESAARIVVSKSASSLTVLDAGGAPIFHAPVTSGSERDPLPLGEWTVTAILRNPTFNYNPDLFWDADPAHSKAKIPPGPNGPVGVVWIDISKEHYGLHGTPEPGQIGHTTSHGCVRLTNWDATTVASLVKKGTPVSFVE